MLITISFKTIGYSFQFGHKAGSATQIWKFSIIKEFYNKVGEVYYASVIFAF